MALDATVLFTRVGLLLGGMNQTNTARGSTLNTRLNSINAEYATAAAQRIVTDSLYTNGLSFTNNQQSFVDYYRDLTISTLRAQCLDDATPSEDNMDAYIKKLIRDMAAAGDTIDLPSTCTATAAAGTNKGDGKLVVTITNPIDKVVNYWAYDEVIRFLCQTDSYDGSATLGNENFLVYGHRPASVFNADGSRTPNPLAHEWPKGSGVNTSLASLNPDDTGNVSNGDLDSWGGTGNNTPTGWNVAGATPGTTLLRDTGYYTGTYAAKFVGNGSETTTIYTILDLDNMLPSTAYALVFWLKCPGGAAAGVLTVTLNDGTGTIITDNGSANQTLTFSNGTITAATSYTAMTGVFYTARSLPSEVRLKFSFTTALTASAAVWIDRICLLPMTQTYAGGPYAAIAGGATGWAKDDTLTNTVVNDASTTKFIRQLDRVWNLAAGGYRLGTSASGSVNDALIT